MIRPTVINSIDLCAKMEFKPSLRKLVYMALKRPVSSCYRHKPKDLTAILIDFSATSSLIRSACVWSAPRPLTIPCAACKTGSLDTGAAQRPQRGHRTLHAAAQSCDYTAVKEVLGLILGPSLPPPTEHFLHPDQLERPCATDALYQ